MKTDHLKLLIIGGYGTFGGRLVRLLSDEPELTILVAGRSLHKAVKLVRAHVGLATLIPLQFDRDGDVTRQVKDQLPDIVIDASGPFQSYGANPYRVVEASIACGAHYIDLADGTAFVQNISSFDSVAKRKEVFVLTGASTCPVLTAAVVEHLTGDLASVDSITGGIAPSPFAGLGLNVVRAIATYAGKPLLVQRDNQLATTHALTESRRYTIAPPGRLPLPPMTFSLLDVPDLQLLAALEPPARNVWFGVATMPASYQALLRLLARCVKFGIFRSIGPLATSMHFFMNHLSWGEHRGGMFIEVRGTNTEQRSILRSWHLVAEGDDGPMIPVLAAVAIIRGYLRNKRPAAGARPAMGVLGLDDYQPLFRQFRISTGTREYPVSDDWSLFRQVLADAWTELPPEIRDLHTNKNKKRFKGQAVVTRGHSLLAGVVAWFVGFPATGDDVPVTVGIQRNRDNEVWMRDFDGHTFSSEISVGKGNFSRLVCERFGPFKFGMALVIDRGALHYVTRRWTFLGIPMPKWLAPAGKMLETVSSGKFNFHVEIVLPIFGHIVTYQGWLEDCDQVVVNS